MKEQGDLSSGADAVQEESGAPSEAAQASNRREFIKKTGTAAGAAALSHFVFLRAKKAHAEDTCDGDNEDVSCPNTSDTCTTASGGNTDWCDSGLPADDVCDPSQGAGLSTDDNCPTPSSISQDTCSSAGGTWAGDICILPEKPDTRIE